MLARAVLLVALVLAGGCQSLDRFAFRNATNADDRALPPGVRLALRLDGVHEFTNEGIPMRRFEMFVEIEQPGDEWQPSFERATLHDDEGHSFPMSNVSVDTRKKQPANIRRYRVVFEIRQPYRFKSILTAIVRWKLTAKGQPDFRVTSHFRS